MFKAKIRVYKNINWKEEEIKKEFDNEKKYNEFVKKNPEFKELSEWQKVSWSKELFDIEHLFDLKNSVRDMNMFDEIEKDFKKLSSKARKLLWK